MGHDSLRPVEQLSEVPGMGSTYARALVPSRARTAVVPERTVAVDGIVQDRARLAQYARVCGFTLRDTVPPTWLHVLTFPLHLHLLGARDSSIRLAGAVHVSNEMTLYRPVRADEPLSLAVHAADLRAHRRGALVDLAGSVHVGDECVWEGRSTYLANGLDAPGDPAEPDRPLFEPRAPHGRWRLAADLGRRYRSVSGDPNPIHVSRIAARAFGFPRPVIHGMWTHARALASLEGRLPASYTAHVSFVKPIFLPGSVGFVWTTRADGIGADVVTPDGAKPHLRMAVRAQ